MQDFWSKRSLVDSRSVFIDEWKREIDLACSQPKAFVAVKSTRPVMERVITREIKHRLPVQPESSSLPRSKTPASLPSAVPAPKSLTEDETGLNAQFDVWFNEESRKTDYSAALRSALMHERMDPFTPMIVSLLPQFEFTEPQSKGLGHLFMRTGPQGVLICLKTLEQMQNTPAMFNTFKETFLDEGDFSLFMNKDHRDNLVYFTQLRGAKLTWWNKLVTQEKTLVGREPLNFNDLLESYRLFETRLVDMGLHSLPTECPFTKSAEIKMKCLLERAVCIIECVERADRPFQLRSLDGLNFEENGALYAMQTNGFKWVSQPMNCSQESIEQGKALNYEVSAREYYDSVTSDAEHSSQKNDQLFYRYLGKNEFTSILDIYGPLKDQITSTDVGFTLDAQAKLLYLLVTAAPSEETSRDVTDFLNALEGNSNLIDLIFVSFNPKNTTAKTPFKILTQLITTLRALNGTDSEYMKKTLPNLLALLHGDRDPRLLTIVLKRHTALSATGDESKRFMMLIDCLTNYERKEHRFLRVLALLSDELSGEKISIVEDLLSSGELLHLMSEINLDQLDDPRAFNVDCLTRISNTVKRGPSTLTLSDILKSELQGIIIGETSNEGCTLTIGQCLQDYVTVINPVALACKVPIPDFIFNVKDFLTDKINSILTKSGEELYAALDEIDRSISQVIGATFFPTPVVFDYVAKTMKPGAEAECFADYRKTLTLRSFIPYFFLGRMKNALTQSVMTLQTGCEELDKFLIGALDRVTLELGSGSAMLFGAAMRVYDTAFESAKLLINALLEIRRTDLDDYTKCVALLKTTGLWGNSLGLQNMALLLIKLSSKPSIILSGMLSSLENIAFPPTDAQMLRAIEDTVNLAHHKEALGDTAYRDLLQKTIQHDLTNQTSFPLAKLITFKLQENRLDPEKIDDLFQSLLRVIRICPTNDEDILGGLIEKTMILIQTHSEKVPNIVSCLAIELANIASHAENPPSAHDVSLPSAGEVDGWFLLDMFSTIMSAIHLLWIMVAALWTTPVLSPRENVAIPADTTLDALKQYTASLDTIEALITREPDKAVTLFNFSPYPSVKQLTAFSEDLRNMSSFDQDPWGHRTNDAVMSQQRATDRVEPVIEQMINLTQDKAFTDEQKKDLKRDFQYVNTIGNSSETPLDVGPLSCDNLALATRDELRGLLASLTQALHHDPGLNTNTKAELTLKLLAVMREAYYRSTGLFPYSTQMLSVLVSLKYPGNLMLQINTGEGKSTTTAILAGLQYVLRGAIHAPESKLAIQLVLTANQELVSQSYNESKHFFNDFLGCVSSVMTQDCKLEEVDIAYTTPQELSFYRQQLKHEGREFIVDKIGKPRRIGCIFDECDAAFLDAHDTQFMLVEPRDQTESRLDNPDAWIYPLVVKFVEETTEKRLRQYIEETDLTTNQRTQLCTIDELKLDTWERVARESTCYKEKEHFVILDGEKREIDGVERSMALVTPLNRANGPQRGATFIGCLQPILQAKMKLQYPFRHFPIDPEVKILDQESAKSLMDVLLKRGRIMGVSGTVGSSSELRELNSTLGGMIAIKIPPHLKKRLEVITPRLRDQTKDQDNDLRWIIAQGGSQPLLVFCETISNVHALYDELCKEYPGRVQKITKEELDSESTQKTQHAGNRGMITICTGEMGRGVDFKTEHSWGFHLHQRFIAAERDTLQIMGRVARNGKKGTYSTSFVIEGLPFRYGFSLFGVNQTAAITILQQQQKQMTQDAAKVRHYIEAFDEIKQGILQAFDDYKEQLLRHPHNRIEDSLFCSHRIALIEAIDVELKRILPQDPNPYLNDAISASLQCFKSDLIPALWEQTCLKLESPIQPRETIQQILAGRKVAQSRQGQEVLHLPQDPCLAFLVEFNAKVNTIKGSYGGSVEWQSIYDGIEAIKKSQSADLFYQLDQFLRMRTRVQLRPSVHFFSRPTSMQPVADLLKVLEASPLSKGTNYLVSRAAGVKKRLESIGIYPQALTITHKSSGIGQSFELCITGLKDQELMESAPNCVDYVAYTVDIGALEMDLARLKASRQLQAQESMDAHEQFENDLLRCGYGHTISSNIISSNIISSEIRQSYEELQRITALLPKKEHSAGMFGHLFSLFKETTEPPITPNAEWKQLKSNLEQHVKKAYLDACKKYDEMTHQIGLLERRIQQDKSGPTIIIKTFYSIGELDQYEETLADGLLRESALLVPRA